MAYCVQYVSAFKDSVLEFTVFCSLIQNTPFSIAGIWTSADITPGTAEESHSHSKPSSL
jgi:hypothetical protein